MQIKIKVKVKPNSGKQEVEDKGDFYLVYLKSTPENNKANLELVKLLNKHFGKEAVIKAGFTSKTKLIELRG